MTLGPVGEQQFRHTLAISRGDLTIFFTQPISAGVLAINALVLVDPPLWERLARRESVVA